MTVLPNLIVLVYKKAIQQTIIITVSYIQNFIHYSAAKVNSIYRGNYWGSSVWISMQQVIY